MGGSVTKFLPLIDYTQLIINIVMLDSHEEQLSSSVALEK